MGPICFLCVPISHRISCHFHLRISRQHVSQTIEKTWRASPRPHSQQVVPTMFEVSPIPTTKAICRNHNIRFSKTSGWVGFGNGPIGAFTHYSAQYCGQRALDQDPPFHFLVFYGFLEDVSCMAAAAHDAVTSKL